MFAPLFTLLFAAAACTGSLYLSLGMGLKACPLCFYQRTFAFSLVAVLLVGLSAGLRGRVNLLALPLAIGGATVAGFHVYLVTVGKLECPAGIAGISTAPHQSLAAYVLILLPILYGVFVESRGECLKPLPLLVALTVGGAAGYGSLLANPPATQATAPTQDGEQLESCRVPFKG